MPISRLPDATISPQAFPISNGKSAPRRVLFWRPPIDRAGEMPELPVVTTWPPHLGVQVVLPFAADGVVESINGEIRSALVPAFPSVDVRSRANGTTLSIGVWLDAFATSDDDTARNRGLGLLALLMPGETLGVHISTRFIRQVAQQEFGRMAKRLSAQGFPDSNGPINLERLTVRFNPPNQIITEVDGFDTRPWPDVDFTLAITDTISTAARTVACGSGTASLGVLTCSTRSDVDIDDSEVVGAVLLGLATIPFGVGLYRIGQLIDIGLSGGSGAGASTGGGGGIGCAVAALAQTPVPLPVGRLQAVPSFTRRGITGGGVFLGGSWLTCPRMPRLSVAGPRTFNVFIEEQTVSAVYRVAGVQTRGNLDVIWTGPGVQSPTSRTTRITFDTGSAVDGVVTHSITVTGSDADGMLPPTTLEVRINISTNPLPPGSNLDPDDVYIP